MKELEDLKQKKQRIRSSVKKHSGFQCPFCGNYTRDAKEYYSSLATILALRFISLLNSHNEQGYFDGVMDCIHAVFGGYDSGVRKALEATGYLDTFVQRHGKMDEGSEHKLKCDYCNEWKREELITIDDSKVAKFICEDCLSKKQEK